MRSAQSQLQHWNRLVCMLTRRRLIAVDISCDVVPTIYRQTQATNEVVINVFVGNSGAHSMVPAMFLLHCTQCSQSASSSTHDLQLPRVPQLTYVSRARPGCHALFARPKHILVADCWSCWEQQSMHLQPPRAEHLIASRCSTCSLHETHRDKTCMSAV
jgi:hypothetical protein